MKSGYTVTLAAATVTAVVSKDCNNVDTHSGYFATAIPVTVGSSGQRAFGTGAAGTIFFTSAGTAPPQTAGVPLP